MSGTETPFHAGELAAQVRAGAGDIARRAAPYIRDHLPDQHRAFYQAQPFLVAASSDAEGRLWATIIEGEDGFVHSPDPRTLTVDTVIDPRDPLAESLRKGADIGVVGIELATRRRNRFSGRTRPTDTGFAIDIRQSFGNCPQYINERDWRRVATNKPAEAVISDHLNPEQIARISASDTLFIGSGRHGPQHAASNGFDASHRGGTPGFVRVVAPNRLRIPDYAGNNFFNTIGNLLENPRIGLLFVDFATGGLLHLSGRAEIDWAPAEARDPNILRMIDVQVDAVIDRPNALALRWSAEPTPSRQLVVTDKITEAEGIASFHLRPAKGGPLAAFEAGQHLPIVLSVPTHDTKLRRTYTLSGNPSEDHYRITVKREPNGAASRFLHDKVQLGDVIEAKAPAGDFLIPSGDTPLVLVSAGVGVTPMIAMLHQTVAQHPDRPVWFIHAARNGRFHALRGEVDDLIATSPIARKRIYYSASEAQDVAGQDFDIKGRITAQELVALNAGPNAQYLLCGPLDFMTDLKSGLEALGVGENQIHFEVFAT